MVLSIASAGIVSLLLILFSAISINDVKYGMQYSCGVDCGYYYCSVDKACYQVKIQDI